MKCPHCEEEIEYVNRPYTEISHHVERITIDDVTEGDDIPTVDLADEATLALMANFTPKRRTIMLDWGETDYGDISDIEYPEGRHTLCCPNCSRDIWDALADAFDNMGRPTEWELEEDEEAA